MTDIKTRTASAQTADTAFSSDSALLPEYAPLVAVKPYRPDFVLRLTDAAAADAIRERLEILKKSLNPDNAASRMQAFYERLGLTRENRPAFVQRFGEGLSGEVEDAAIKIVDVILKAIKESGLAQGELTELDVIRFLAPLVQQQDEKGRWHSLPQGDLLREYRKPQCSGFTGGGSMTAAGRILSRLKEDLREALAGEGVVRVGQDELRFRGSCFDVGTESALPFRFTVDKNIELKEQGRSSKTLSVNLFAKDAHDYRLRWEQVAGDVKLTIKPNGQDGRSVEISALEDISEDQEALVGVTVSDGGLESYREVNVLVRDLGVGNSAPSLVIETPEILDGGEKLVAKLVGSDPDPLDGSALKYSWSVESQYGSIEPISGEGTEIQIPTPAYLKSANNHDNLLIRARVDDGHEDNHSGEAIKKVVVLGTEPAPPEEKTTQAKATKIFDQEPKAYLARRDDLFLGDRSGSMDRKTETAVQMMRDYLESEYKKVKEGGLCRIRFGWYESCSTQITYDSGWFEGHDQARRQRVFQDLFAHARGVFNNLYGGSETLWHSLWDITIGHHKLDFARGPAEKPTVIPVCDWEVHDRSNQVPVPGHGLFTIEDALDLIWDQGIEVKFLEVR